MIIRKALLVISVFVAVLAVLGWGLQDTDLASYQLQELTEVRGDGFEVRSVIELVNPSMLPVPVTSANYTFTLRSTGEELSSGDMRSFVLWPGTTQTEMYQDVYWQPAPDVVLELVTREQVLMDVHGSVAVRTFLHEPLVFSFNDTIDIKEYIREQERVEAGVVDEDDGFLDDLNGLI